MCTISFKNKIRKMNETKTENENVTLKFKTLQ